jgi:hypothetical protein
MSNTRGINLVLIPVLNTESRRLLGKLPYQRLLEVGLAVQDFPFARVKGGAYHRSSEPIEIKPV